MLGFSPLAGAPLGGDEDQAVVDGAFQPSAIVTGAPVVATVALSYNHDVAADDIVTAAPVAAPVALSYEQDLSAAGIVTAAPVLGTPLAEEAQPFPVNGIVTGAPTIRGSIDTLGSIDAYVRALYAAGVNNSNTSRFQFSPDGTKYFLLTTTSGRPPQRYDLTTPWNVGTGTLVNSNNFNITTTHSIQDFQLSDDGLYIAFLMWANSDGKSSIHLYSLDQPFVTNYAGLVSSAASDDGYTFVRSFIIDQGYRRIRAFRHFDGKLYTVDAPLTQNSTLQRRTVNNALFSSLGVFNNTIVQASTLTTTVTGYSIAFLSLDGTSRIYHDRAAYDPLTLAQLEVSGQTLGFNVKYQLKPDGIGILTPNLAEIDTDTSVTIEQEGAFGALGVATGQPVIAEVSMAQQIVFAPTAALTGSPVIGQTTYTQSHHLSAVAIATGAPVLAETDIDQAHQVEANGITTGQPVLQPTNTFGSGALFATDIIVGQPVAAQADLGQRHSSAPVALLTGSPVIETAITQENVLSPVGIVTGDPAVSDSNISQAHQLGAGNITNGQPVLQATDAFVSNTLFAAGIIAGAPDLGLLSLSQEQQVVVDPITAGQPSLQNADMVQGITLAAVNINAAPPSLDLTSISQDHEFALDGVTSEPPSLGQTIVTQGQFSALRITAGSPVIGLLTMQREQALSADGITTAPPALVTLLLNGSARRIVDQSASSNNNVAVTTGSNIAIVSERYIKSA